MLGLGSEARMNQPGRAAGAWKWRLGAIPPADLARRLRAASEAAGR
jgi:4-alpha-glucanotransferase